MASILNERELRDLRVMLRLDDPPAGADARPSFVMMDHRADKLARTELHGGVRMNLGKFVNSDTVEDKAKGHKEVRLVLVGEKVEGAMFHDRRAKGNGGGRAAEPWPSDRPDNLQFIMCKQNIDVNHALSLLSTQLRCTPKIFSFTGTKDKRGVTMQLVSG
jgi:tRNA(Glu) U13 pseudouridine synthase TruD